MGTHNPKKSFYIKCWWDGSCLSTMYLYDDVTNFFHTCLLLVPSPFQNYCVDFVAGNARVIYMSIKRNREIL